MNESVMDSYLTSIRQQFDPPDTKAVCADIAAGTGLFTKALLRDPRFSIGTLIAIDSARSMLEELAGSLDAEERDRVSLIEADFLQWEPPEELSLCVCSEAIHLFSDFEAFVEKVRQCLRPEGLLAIRTSSHQQLYSREWYNFFPSARVVDLKRHWSACLIRAVLEMSGFTVEHICIDESQEMRWDDVVGFFAEKPFSTLHLIDEQEYSEGMSRLRERAAKGGGLRFDYKMSLYLARRN